MRISVLIPTLNPKKEYLQQAIDSIPASVDEIVLAGSGFNTSDYKFRPGSTVVLFNTTDGLKETINRAILEDRLTGDYFSILPDDDFYTEAIEGIIENVKDGCADVVNFAMLHCNENGMLPDVHCSDENVTFEKNYERNAINGSAFINTNSFIWLEGYKCDLCGDWDLFNRALKSGMYFEHIKTVGLVLRLNKHSRFQKMARCQGFDKIKNEIRRHTDAWDKRFYARCAGWAGC